MKSTIQKRINFLLAIKYFLILLSLFLVFLCYKTTNLYYWTAAICSIASCIPIVSHLNKLKKSQFSSLKWVYKNTFTLFMQLWQCRLGLTCIGWCFNFFVKFKIPFQEFLFKFYRDVCTSNSLKSTLNDLFNIFFSY